MQHLDEGLLMALLDGELVGSDRQQVEAHLAACAECSARRDELRGLTTEADDLVVALGQPDRAMPRAVVTPLHRTRLTSRRLAWAASIIAVMGLGVAGSTLLIRSDKGARTIALDQVAPQSRSQVSAPETLSPAPSPAASEAVRGERRRMQPEAGAAGPPRETTPPPAAARVADESAQLGVIAGERDLADLAQARDTARAPAVGAAAARHQREPLSLQPRPNRFALAPTEAAAKAAGNIRGEPAIPPHFQRVSMEEAVRQLSGAIRLIDGLTPEEFEVAASDSAQPLVRVIYRVGAAETRLVLEQGRVDNSFVASDLQGFNSTVEQALSGNQLSWHDLAGFSLRLYGRISPDSLFHFKSLVK